MAANLDLLENRIRLLLTFGVTRGSFIDQIGQRRGSVAAAGGGGERVSVAVSMWLQLGSEGRCEVVTAVMLRSASFSHLSCPRCFPPRHSPRTCWSSSLAPNLTSIGIYELLLGHSKALP
jgi:hypothetical protein